MNLSIPPPEGAPLPLRISIAFTGKGVSTLPPQNRSYLKTFGLWSLIIHFGTYLGLGSDVKTLSDRATTQNQRIDTLCYSEEFLESKEIVYIEKIISFLNANLLQPDENHELTKEDYEWNMLVFAKVDTDLTRLQNSANLRKKCQVKWTVYNEEKLKVKEAMVKDTENFSDEQKEYFNSLSFKDQLLCFLEQNSDLSKRVLDMLDVIEYHEFHSTDKALGNKTYQEGTQVMKAALGEIGKTTFASSTRARRERERERKP